MGMGNHPERGFYTIEEAAHVLGRKVSTFKKWLQTGKAVGSLFMVHGQRIQRVVKCHEVERLLALEIPDIGSQPDSHHQWLWKHRRWRGPKTKATSPSPTALDPRLACLVCMTGGPCTKHQEQEQSPKCSGHDTLSAIRACSICGPKS